MYSFKLSNIILIIKKQKQCANSLKGDTAESYHKTEEKKYEVFSH